LRFCQRATEGDDRQQCSYEVLTEREFHWILGSVKKLLSKLLHWVKMLFGFNTHEESDTEYNDRAW
jgi:hypothetical protein